MDVGKRIKEIRYEKKLSLQKVSGDLNWSVSKLSKIERGEQGIYIDELEQLAQVLDIEIGSIIDIDKNNFLNTLDDSNTADILSGFENIAKEYLSGSRGDFRNSEVGKIVTKELPKTIMQNANINSTKYLVAGSIGKGQFAEIPWIAIFRKSITKSATKGIYIVYLFKADMSGVYLSLNQGFTFFREKFGTKQGRKEIQNVALYLQELCNTIPEDLELRAIDLEAKGVLGRGYMPGHIAGKYYDINNLPSDDKLIDDLRNLMSVYEEVVGIINNRSVEEFYNYVIAQRQGVLLDDDEVNEKLEEIIQEVEEDNDEDGYSGAPKDKKDLVKDNTGSEKYPRNPAVAAKALKLSGYTCEIDNEHPTFIRKSSGKNYTEPHHLIPISEHQDFSYSLDVEENICSLCSNCHNCIHYGVDSEKEKLLRKLYEERKDLLDRAGLGIDFEKLKIYYGIS
ncbi:MrcB family domain-containing protein [Wukongibacter baidiensis]